MNKEKILKLYPGFIDVAEPFIGNDGRKRTVLKSAEFRSKNKLVSYPKLLLEEKLGRRLKNNETCDHEDDDKTNDAPSNLQVLSREDNARKGSLGNK